MADKRIADAGNTIVVPASLTTNDWVPISRNDVSDGKVDLSLLVPPEIDLTSVGATGAKSITIAPAFPAANAGSYYLRVATAATGTPDEQIQLGYNVSSLLNTEPSSTLNQEINWLATARGQASQRTMEAYFQFSGATPSDNAVRPFFFAYEPGDTSRASISPHTANAKGELLYSYLSTGFNRCGTDGGGGLTIATSLNEAVAGGMTGDGFAFFDIDGCRMEFLRSCPDIALITTAGTTSTMVLTVPTGHNIRVGARVQVWKPDGLGSYTLLWNGGAAVIGTVTARTDTTMTTDIDNTSLGIVGGAYPTGYGFSLPRSPVAGYQPTFLQLAVGTGAPYASLPFQMEVVGASCVKGFLQIATGAYAAANPSINDASFYQSPLAFLSTGAASASGRRQLITASNGTAGWSLGYADDAANNLDDYIFAIGGPQSTDSNFTVAKSSLCSINDGSNGYVGIGGVSGNFGATKLTIGAGTSTVAQIQLVAGTAKTTPLAGEMCYDGTNFKVCKVAGTWATVTAV